LVLVVHALVPSQEIDRPSLRGRHEPRARIVRHAIRGPALEGDDERILRELFREPTSFTMRASPAIRRGDSIRQTASIARWVSVTADQEHSRSAAATGR
jgi:hypothetical protein